MWCSQHGVKTPLWIEQQHRCTMIHAVLKLIRRVRFNKKSNAQLGSESLQLLRGTRQAGKCWVKIPQVCSEFLRCVALRVNRDQVDLRDVSSPLCRRVLSQHQLSRLLQLVEGIGTHIRAGSKTKEDQRPMPPEIIQCEWFAALIQQREILNFPRFRQYNYGTGGAGLMCRNHAPCRNARSEPQQGKAN